MRKIQINVFHPGEVKAVYEKALEEGWDNNTEQADDDFFDSSMIFLEKNGSITYMDSEHEEFSEYEQMGSWEFLNEPNKIVDVGCTQIRFDSNEFVELSHPEDGSCRYDSPEIKKLLDIYKNGNGFYILGYYVEAIKGVLFIDGEEMPLMDRSNLVDEIEERIK